MTSQVYDCKTLSPLDPGTPYYHQCFGFGQLPNAFNFEAGPFTNVMPPPYPPNIECPLINKNQRTGQLVRENVCEFNYSWSDGDFGIILSVNENQVPLSTKINQTNADLADWRVGGTLLEYTKTASCSMNMSTGIVTFEMVGIIRSDVCQAPFRIWFLGTTPY